MILPLSVTIEELCRSIPHGTIKRLRQIKAGKGIAVDIIVFVVGNLSVSSNLDFQSVFVIGFSMLSTPSEKFCAYQATYTNTM